MLIISSVSLVYNLHLHVSEAVDAEHGLFLCRKHDVEFLMEGCNQTKALDLHESQSFGIKDLFLTEFLLMYILLGET